MATTGRRRRTPGAGGRRHHHGHEPTAHGESGASSERWLVTYADMLTLLLVLFIVLFSISVVNTSKFISLKTSLAAAFGTGPHAALVGGNGLLDNSSNGSGQQLVMPGEPVQAGSTAAPETKHGQTPADTGETPEELRNFAKIEKEINAALARGGLRGAAQFAIDRRGLVITVVTDALVFPGNSARLLSKGQHILRVIAPPLRDLPNSIEVDGHTNQEKVSTYPYPSGWELSSARASAVVRYLISAGVAKSRLRAVGFSDQRPLVPPDDPRSITRNRRVDIVVLSASSAAASDGTATPGSR